MSMTSSCTSVAVWIISTTAAMRMVAVRDLADQLRGEQHQNGAQPLAAAILQIAAEWW